MYFFGQHIPDWYIKVSLWLEWTIPMCQLVSAAIGMPHMQGCMYSLKIVVPGMSLVILLPACQLNRGLKLKLQLRAYYKKSLFFTDQRKIFMLIDSL